MHDKTIHAPAESRRINSFTRCSQCNTLFEGTYPIDSTLPCCGGSQDLAGTAEELQHRIELGAFAEWALCHRPNDIDSAIEELEEAGGGLNIEDYPAEFLDPPAE